MDVVRNDYKGLNLDKKVYRCSTCDKLFNWDENSSWYGSIKQMDEGTIKLFFCSDKCEK